MRIALIAYACDPTAGSEPGVGWQWARHLLARGHEVDLVTRDDPDRLDRLGPLLAGMGGRLHVVPRPRPRGPGQQWRAYTGWLDRVSDRLPDADLVHHVTYGSLKGGSVRTDRPLVFGPVGGAESAPLALAPVLGLRALAVERTRDLVGARSARAARAVATAELVLATNRVTLRAARDQGARRAELMLADGLSADYLVATPAARDLAAPLVLWVGSFQPRKAPLLALRAFALLRRQLPAARLRMVGTGPMLAATRAERDRLGLADAVELTGRIPWPDLPAHYDEAAVLLFSSVRDAFGGQGLEAWGRGLPSVGLDQFGLADHAPDGGCVLVPPGRPGAVAAGLSAALLATVDPGAHPDRAVAALAAARRHTWDAKVTRLEALLAGVPAA